MINERTEISLALLGNIMDSVGRIFADRPLLFALLKRAKAEVIRRMTADHPEDTVHILASCKGLKDEEYNVSAVELLKDLMALLDNKEIADFFGWSERRAKTSAGSVMQSSEEQKPGSSSDMQKADGTSTKRKKKSE